MLYPTISSSSRRKRDGTALPLIPGGDLFPARRGAGERRRRWGAERVEKQHEVAVAELAGALLVGDIRAFFRSLR